MQENAQQRASSKEKHSTLEEDSLLSFDYRTPISPEKAPRENVGRTKGSLILG